MKIHPAYRAFGACRCGLVVMDSGAQKSETTLRIWDAKSNLNLEIHRNVNKVSNQICIFVTLKI